MYETASCCAAGQRCEASDYNDSVARGWESKSIEAQQAEAGEKSSGARRKLTPEEAERERTREGLELSRKRILGQLEASSDPRRCEMLEKALAELNEKLRELQDRAATRE